MRWWAWCVVGAALALAGCGSADAGGDSSSASQTAPPSGCDSDGPMVDGGTGADMRQILRPPPKDPTTVPPIQ